MEALSRSLFNCIFFLCQNILSLFIFETNTVSIFLSFSRSFLISSCVLLTFASSDVFACILDLEHEYSTKTILIMEAKHAKNLFITILIYVLLLVSETTLQYLIFLFDAQLLASGILTPSASPLFSFCIPFPI